VNADFVSRTRCGILHAARRAGTLPDSGVRYGPGSAAHHAAKSGALRCVRRTVVPTPAFDGWQYLCIFSLQIVRDRTDAAENFGLKFVSSSWAFSMSKDSKGQPPDRHDWFARAAEALEKARRMKPGRERNEALKKAGQLQSAADMMGYLKSKELRPPK
jgi:hypothetical protein